MARSGKKEELVLPPSPLLKIPQHAAYPDVPGEGEQRIANIVHVPQLPRRPEKLRLIEEPPLVLRNEYRDTELDRPVVPLALIPVVMGMKYRANGLYTEALEMIENHSATEIYQQCVMMAHDDVNITRVLKDIEVR